MDGMNHALACVTVTESCMHHHPQKDHTLVRCEPQQVDMPLTLGSELEEEEAEADDEPL